MQSTREFLSQDSQRELSFLTDMVEGCVAHDPRATKNAEILIGALVAFMQREKLTLLHDESNQFNIQLLDFLVASAFKRKQDIERFNQSLLEWAKAYRQYVAEDRAKMQTLFKAQPPGIFRTLKQGGDASRIFGDDYDARLVLKDVIIRQASEVQADRFNVLAPVSLDTPDHLRHVIADVCQGNEDKDFKLLVLGNCGQNHWRVVAMSVSAGRIVRAGLWDPMQGEAESLLATAAYRNLSAAVNAFNGDDDVVPVVQMAGVQRNGHSCMDRGVQKILQLVGSKSEIAQLASDEELREKVGVAVCEGYIVQADDGAAEASSSVMVEGYEAVEEVEEVEVEKSTLAESFAALDYRNKQDADALHDWLAVPAHKQDQIQFDETMARELQVSLDRLDVGDSRSVEAALFDAARQHAYSEMLARFGLMAKPVSVVADKGVTPGVFCNK